MKTAWVLFLFFAITLFAHQKAEAWNSNPPWRWNSGVWRIGLTGNYVHTTQNYDTSAGNFVQLPAGNYLDTYEFFPRVRYNLSREVSVYGGINGSQLRTQTGGQVREKSAVNEVVAGTDLLIYKGWAHLIASLEGGFPVFQINTSTNEPLTSDGVWYAQGQLYLYRPWGALNSFGDVGFRARGEGLAQLLTYELGVEVPFSHNFLVGGGVDGASTIVKDQLTAAERTVVTSRVNGGSHYYYAHDPSWIEWEAWAGYSPVKAWQVKGGYSQTFNGKNAAQYPKVFLSLSFDFDPEPDRGSFDQYSERSEHTSTTPHHHRKHIKKRDSFEPDTHEVDENLFRDDDEPFQRQSPQE